MKILSIRQPWAWAIIHAGKDVENRSWQTKVRGRVLIHAGTTMDGGDRAAERDLQRGRCPVSNRELRFELPGYVMPEVPLDLPRGGIVGSVEIVDCVTEHPSQWFVGPFGFVLRDPRPLLFMPLSGRLGFFDAPTDLVAQIGGDA